jgi:hypothetical protein
MKIGPMKHHALAPPTTKSLISPPRKRAIAKRGKEREG